MSKAKKKVKQKTRTAIPQCQINDFCRDERNRLYSLKLAPGEKTVVFKGLGSTLMKKLRADSNFDAFMGIGFKRMVVDELFFKYELSVDQRLEVFLEKVELPENKRRIILDRQKAFYRDAKNTFEKFSAEGFAKPEKAVYRLYVRADGVGFRQVMYSCRFSNGDYTFLPDMDLAVFVGGSRGLQIKYVDRDTARMAVDIAEVALRAVSLILKLLDAYLRGWPLPRLSDSDDVIDMPIMPDAPHDGAIKPRTKTPVDPDIALKEAKEHSCLANIYFDPRNGTLSIGGGRHYKKAWWIVCGHRRQYRSGKVAQVQPYIKGDRENPDAQRALAVFIECQRKINCFQAK